MMMKKHVLYVFMTAMLAAVSCTNDIPANVSQGILQKIHPAAVRVTYLMILVKFPLLPMLLLRPVLHNWEVMEAAVLKKGIR